MGCALPQTPMELRDCVGGSGVYFGKNNYFNRRIEVENIAPSNRLWQTRTGKVSVDAFPRYQVFTEIFLSLSAIRYTMEICNYLGIPKVNICTPSVSALQIFDREKQSSIASNFHRHSPRITSSAQKHFGVAGQTIPFYELINFENLDVELILTRMPMHDKKAFQVAKNGMPLPDLGYDGIHMLKRQLIELDKGHSMEKIRENIKSRKLFGNQFLSYDPYKEENTALLKQFNTMPYSVQDQITELSKKLALHEGDLKAYDEASKQEIQQNFEKITELRASNKTLHKKLADSVNGDCKVIENALGDRKVERQALRSKPGREAVEIIDQKVCDYIKKLNAMKAETERKRKKCEEAKIRKEMVAKDLNDQMANSKGESEQAKYLRSIENRLDKAILKQQEAEHVKALYEKMRDQLQAKALTFHNTLEAREMEIEEANRELKRVKEMLVDAQDARDAAKTQFNQNEEVLIKERRQRERELQELRLRAEEKRGVEIMERRATRTSLSRTGSTPPAAPSADQTISQVSSADLEAQLKHYETIYQKIKDATGVSSIAEAVNRFESQGETASHLQNLKRENENKLATLKEEKTRLESQFNTLQYSDAESVAKIDSELKQAQSELDQMIKEKQESQDQLDKQNKLLLNVRSGVQHLADKLDFVDGKVDPDSVPDSPVPASDQPDDIIKQISHILSRSGLRINNLMNSLGEDGLEGAKARAGNDLSSWATTRVEEIQPYSTIRTTKANANTQRVPGDLSDSETSGEDDGQMLTRDAIKKQAQNIIDSKTKKRKIKKGKR